MTLISQVGLFITYHSLRDGTEGHHILSVLVEKENNLITRATIMETMLFPVSYNDNLPDVYTDYYIEREGILRFWVALRLLFLVNPENTLEDIFYVTNVVKSRSVDQPIRIQEGEGKEGFCQHWDTFFLYMTMVRGFSPLDVFERLARMSAKERSELIYNFSNEVAQEAQVKAFVGTMTPSSVPIQSTTAMQPAFPENVAVI